MRKAYLLILAFIFLLAPSKVLAEESGNLLYNGDFSVQSEQQALPAGWYYEAWYEENSQYYTRITETGEAVVVIENAYENDARICQKLKVKPNTWYRFSCDMLATGIAGDMGATISVLDTFAASEPLYFTNGWQRTEFIGLTGSKQTEIVVALRLGGYGALASGHAQYKNISVAEAKRPAYGAISLETQAPIRKAERANTGPKGWISILFITAVCAAAFFCVYKRGIRQREEYATVDKSQMITVFIIAILLRVLLSIIFVGHSTDLGCFIGWAESMAANGAGNFYTSGIFADYPPGYMYVLWVLGGLRRLLGLGYDSALYVLLIKSPSIAADCVSAYILYRIAVKQGMREGKALWLLELMALNPAAAFISGGWGQIDSLLALALAGVCWLFINNRLILAGALYGAAILIKPQALMAGPLLALAYLMPAHGQTFTKRFSKAIPAVLSALLLIVVLSWPFLGTQEITWLYEKYFGTITSYPYASIEAFNLFSLFGGNWTSIEDVFIGFSFKAWGVANIVLSVVTALFLYWKAQKENPKGALFLSLAFLLASLFTLGPYMHERYLFPVLLMLIVSVVYYDDRRLLIAYLWFSASFLLNSLCAFYVVDHQEMRGFSYDAITFTGSLLTVVGFFYLAYICYDIVFRAQSAPTTFFSTLQFEEYPDEKPALLQPTEKLEDILQLQPYDFKLQYTRKDMLYCICLTAVYAIFALTNLGSLNAPESEYVSNMPGEVVYIAFQEESQVSEFWIFGGIAEGSLLMQTDQGEEISFEQKFDDMFRWKRVSFYAPASSIRIYTYSGELRIREIAFFDESGKLIPTTANDLANPLVDESDTVPQKPSYFNGMYFDELYHGRTAYEHLYGLDPYENSHPPLGKALIMVGVAIFGMNPFGWRIVGALLGILMVPILYAFGKRLFRSSDFALLTATLFTFDFMHFTQTRIATIDVYGIFFILLMYYYMYQYYCMNFYVDGLKATLKPLGLAGLFFGLGAASKWICIYAGGGLAILLALSLWKRYREYKAAIISEDSIRIEKTKHFGKYTIQTLLWCCLFYILVPVIIYLLSYIPYFLSEGGYGIADVWNYQVYMWDYHSKLDATHPFESTWWQWPFTLRPMWYYMGESEPAGMLSTLSASGNPAVWWVCTLAMLVLLGKRLMKSIKQESGMTMAFVAIAANYLPWVLVTRCTFIYHFFATVPFIIFCGVYLLWNAETQNKRLRWIKWAWMGMALLLFLLLYPGISGLPIPIAYAELLRYLPGGNLLYGV